ncbi:GIY-YIG nuclease family protein [Aliikangiella marina]|uniref:GIY-YIG nuclease family protein n=1 Tax=Aliikangiella marina TaxID=1712262 RepID=A0A545T2F0_9GAMM|nr:GIY-YIG nuclease family protein [Aliikangiella marina]TQV71365.1 GIY-YIG nuclease family protein [Aliikangiella marina]
MVISWFIYIIEAQNGSLYTGITTDVQRRWREHQGMGAKSAKAAKFFRTSKPKSILYIELAKDRSEASKKEAQIKKLTKQKKLALVKSSGNKINEFKFNQ